MLDAVKSLLRRSTGLDAPTLGSSAVERAVELRMAACREREPEAYLRRLEAPDGLELQELVEAIVVPETWFFRDPEAFAALARLATECLATAEPSRVLRLLSLPCSTGEEPYTMAMALADAGVAPGRFHIDAMDISERALARARRCQYGRNSFRGADLGFRDRHFTASGEGWHLRPELRRQVRFHARNLFADGDLPGSAAYDFVFCRNLLIYFDRPTQDRAVSLLARRLSPAGALFVAPAEMALLLEHGFTPLRLPRSFAMRPPQPRPSAPPPRPAPVAARLPAPSLPPPRPAPRAVAPPPPPPALAAQRDPAADLQALRRLADQGALAEAARLGAQYLHAHGPSAEAYYLLGLVHDAAGRPAEAADAYRRAIYLDPRHHEALVQLSLLREREGDHAGARALTDRARRTEKRVTP